MNRNDQATIHATLRAAFLAVVFTLTVPLAASVTETLNKTLTGTPALSENTATGNISPVKGFLSTALTAVTNSVTASANPLRGTDLSTIRSEDISDSQLRGFIRQAEEEGISKDEAFNLARQRGLPATEEQSLRARIRELQRRDAERPTDTRPAETRPGVPTLARPDTVEPVRLAPDRPEPDTIPQPTEAEADRELQVIQQAIEMLPEPPAAPQPIYGHSIFVDQTLEVFRTIEGARAPETYILGPGDEIRINIFGTSQADLLLEINDEGYVQPSGMPKIFLKGLTIAEARSVLRQRLSQFYTFQSDQFALRIHSARTITINVFGESRVTGSFTVSALNTAFNALSASGGPTSIGSVRDIRLIRGNERRRLDVYEFMFDPAVQFDFDLRHNDIIYVPVAEKIVRVSGAVKRPKRYELTANEDLADLIRFAGGINYDTSPDFVQVQRIVDGEPRLMEWRLDDVLSGREQVTMEDGDIVRVRTIGRPLEQFVTIEGSVFYPGRYNLQQSPTLRALLDRAEIRPQAKTDLLFIERIREDETVRIIPVEWERLVEANDDFALERRDNVILFDQERYRHVARLQVTGNVRNPFERTLSYDERITLRNAVDLAGGLRPTAAETGFVFRRNLFNPDIVEHLRVDLTRDADFRLQPGDQLRVYDQSSYSDVGELSIRGLVNDPFSTQFDPELTVSDLLTMAGGFRRGAALDRIDIFRLDVSFRRGTSYEVITLKADSLLNIVGQPEGFRLQPFDRVVVRRIPEYNVGTSVEISGEVRYPGSYPLESRRTHLSDVIRQSGGFTSVADPKNAVILRSFENTGPIAINIRQAMRNRGRDRYDPIIFDDDLILVPKFENIVSIRVNATRVGELQRFGVIVPDTDMGLPDRINVTWKGSRSAKWYIENYAGGFAEEADRWSVTVTRPSGEVEGTRRRLLFFRNYPDVEPGSTIALRLEPPPDPVEEEDLIDWDQVFARSMQMTTSILTILILMDRLQN